MKKLLNTSMIYFIAAILAGVFFREFTKFNHYTAATALGRLHTHLFVLGMFLFLILALFCQKEDRLWKNRSFSRFFVLYNIALPFMTVTMLVRGIVQVLEISLSNAADAMISGFAGISHILLTIAFFLLFSALKAVFVTKED